MLNAECKMNRGSDLCEQKRCTGTMPETTMHFIFVCPQYAEDRQKMTEKIVKIYDKEKKEFANKSDEIRWRMMLFPFESGIRCSTEEDELDRLLHLRKEILFAVLLYVVKTRRYRQAEDESFWEM